MLVDILSPDPRFGPASREAIRTARAEGVVMACEVVWAEVTSLFSSAEAADETLGRLDVRFAALDPEVAAGAGQVWSAYRRSGGLKERVVADFLIGAHAWMRADRFLTRDRGFYRAYFKRLRIVDPSSS
ncbi:MAG: type II toxin-antitoxin system VapC family toxin [Actinomycetota bacterium]